MGFLCVCVYIYIYIFKILILILIYIFNFQIWDFKQLHTYLRMLQQLFYVSIAKNITKSIFSNTHFRTNPL
jgi:hypothetical protein